MYSWVVSTFYKPEQMIFEKKKKKTCLPYPWLGEEEGTLALTQEIDVLTGWFFELPQGSSAHTWNVNCYYILLWPIISFLKCVKKSLTYGALWSSCCDQIAHASGWVSQCWSLGVLRS